MATSKFIKYFQTTVGVPLIGANIWLVPQSDTYPTNALELTAHGTRDGVYYREAVPDGEYKIYIDVAGGTSPELYEEHIWVGENKISIISAHFNEYGRILPGGVDSACIGSGLAKSNSNDPIQVNFDNSTIGLDNNKLSVLPESVTNSQLADDAVSTDKIQDSAVNGNKIGSAAITPDKIANQEATVISTSNPTPAYVGQPGRDANGRKYRAISLTGTCWEVVQKIDNVTIVAADNGTLTADTADKARIINGYIEGVPNQIVYQHHAGSAEYAGNATQSGVKGYGIYYVPESRKIFQRIRIRFWNTGGGTCAVRICKSLGKWTNLESTNGVISDLTLIEELLNVTMNADANGYQLINLSSPVTIASGEYLYVLIKDTSTTGHLAYWDANPGGRTYYIFSSASDPFNASSAWSISSGARYSTPLQLEIYELSNTVKSYLENVTSDVQAQISARALPVAGKLKGIWLANEQWVHPRGSGEYVGNSSYGGPTVSVATYDQITSDSIFDQVAINAYGGSDSVFQVRVYKHSVFSANPSAMTLLEEVNFAAGTFNVTAGSLALITMSKAYRVTAGEYVYVFVRLLSGKYPRLYRWTLYAGSSPERHQLLLAVNLTNWTTEWSQGSVPSYCATPVKLLLSSAADSTFLSAALARIATLESNSVLKFDPKISMPATIDVAVDRELNIWHDALCLAFWPGLTINYASTVGACKERSFRYTPAVSGTASVTITVRDRQGNSLATKTFTINAVSKTAGSGTKQILFVGDSLTANGYIATEVKTLITNDGGFTPLLLGTQGTPPNRHEGRGGWSFESWIGSSSPFNYSGTLKLKQYMSDNSFFGGSDTIDFCIIQLGINDTFGAEKTQAEIDTIINNAKTLINAVLHATYGYPNCKIIIGMPPICGNSRDGCGANYGALYEGSAYERSMRKLWISMVAAFDAGAYNANVKLCSAGLWVDRTYGYPISTVNASSRNTTQISEQTNYVHPSDSGYYQLADAYYSALRALLS